MNPFGDGSNGALNVTSGTTNLLLNTKYQFTTVNVAAGATIRPSGTTGAVLYICATESITIDGTINTSNVVNYGNNTWGVTIDGVSYTSPGVAIGGSGGDALNTQYGRQQDGFGGGGRGRSASYASTQGGDGGNGSQVSGIGASPVSSSSKNNTEIRRHGNSAINGAGGSGGIYIKNSISGSYISGSTNASSGRGGNAYGQNGSDGSISSNLLTTGGGTWAAVAGGGGGGGGRAGRSGVHVVLKSPEITINGTINTSGTSGGNGGKGGITRLPTTSYTGGPISAGGGGGGGNGGDIYLSYNSASNLSGSLITSGGSSGLAGDYGQGNIYSAQHGLPGLSGNYSQEQLTPIALFSSTTTSGVRPLTVNFTSTSSGATSWLWTFGDGTTSTQENPTKVYSAVGTYTVSLKATNSVGDNTITKTNYITTTVGTYTRTASASLKIGASATRLALFTRTASATIKFGVNIQSIVLRDTQAIEEKRYLYKVYDEDGTYIETWADVTDNPEFTTEINELGSTMTVILARNSDSLGTSTAPLQTESGTTITTEAGQDILVSTQSRNQVGPGSSVLHNNRVDVYVFYGEISPLLTEAGEEITTEDGEVILASMGAPNGRRIFSGFISEINSRYGNTETTIVQLSSYGFDLNQFVLDDTDGKTTVTFNSTDPSVMAQMALDRFATVSSPFNTYTRRTPTSIALSGTSVSYTFRVNTFGDVMKKILELLPPNWYFYVGLGDNTVYFRERSATPQHLFYLGKHIKALDLKSSIIDVKNDVYFTGGGEPALFKRYTEAPAPRTRRGLSLYSDSRVTLEASADVISEGIIDENNKVQYRSTVEVLAKVYDIESINVGDVIGFRNFGNFADSLTFSIQGINYTPDSVTLALQTLPPTITKRLEDLRRNQIINENQNVPDAPTT